MSLYKNDTTRVKVFIADYNQRGKFILLDDYYTCNIKNIPKYGSTIFIKDDYDSIQQVLCSYIEYEYNEQYGIIPIHNILVGCEDNSGEEVRMILTPNPCEAVTPFEKQLNEEVWQLMSTKRINCK